MLSWFFGLVAGSGVTILAAWYFYRRSKTDTKRLEEAVLEAILPNLNVEKTAQQPQPSAKAKAKPVSNKDIVSSLLDEPENIRNKILQQVVNGHLYGPDVHILARMLRHVAEDISKISSLYAQIGDHILHGKVEKSFEKQDELKKKLKKMLKKKGKGS